MPDRETILGAIDALYAHRLRGDKDGVAAFFAPHATFRISGHGVLTPKLATGGGAAMPTIETLIEDFTFHQQRRLDAVVEGDKAVVIWEATLSYRGGERVTTEICDLWTVGADGKFTSLLQFVDTALAVSLTEA